MSWRRSQRTGSCQMTATIGRKNSCRGRWSSVASLEATEELLDRAALLEDELEAIPADRIVPDDRDDRPEEQLSGSMVISSEPRGDGGAPRSSRASRG